MTTWLGVKVTPPSAAPVVIDLVGYLMLRKMLTYHSILAISAINQKSWEGQASRLHIVYKVFPFNVGTTKEIMIYAMSKYIYDDKSTGQLPWAARLGFERSNGKIAVNFYQVYSVRLYSIRLQTSQKTAYL